MARCRFERVDCDRERVDCDRIVRSLESERSNSRLSNRSGRRSLCCRSDRAFSVALRGTLIRSGTVLRADRVRSREEERRPIRPLSEEEERRASDWRRRSPLSSESSRLRLRSRLPERDLSLRSWDRVRADRARVSLRPDRARAERSERERDPRVVRLRSSPSREDRPIRVEERVRSDRSERPTRADRSVSRERPIRPERESDLDDEPVTLRSVVRRSPPFGARPIVEPRGR